MPADVWTICKDFLRFFLDFVKYSSLGTFFQETISGLCPKSIKIFFREILKKFFQELFYEYLQEFLEQIVQKFIPEITQKIPNVFSLEISMIHSTETPT